MKRQLLLLITLLAFMPVTLRAQKTASHDAGRHAQWMEEMRTLRVNYVAKELDLTKQQAERFTPLYQQMSRELEKVMTDTRRMCESVRKKGNAATDLELEKAAEAAYEQKGKESAIEMRYFSRYKSILTPRQLFKLRKAEHKFNRELMKQHRQRRAQKK